MSPDNAAARARQDITDQGWTLTSDAELGLSRTALLETCRKLATPDPRGHGKLHARDVVSYDHTLAGVGLEECDSIAHVDGTDDYSRFRLLDDGRQAAETMLRLAPLLLRWPFGRMSADFFSYSPGTYCPPHQDKFGDFVVIWTLDRQGSGAESFLTTLEGGRVMRRVLKPGDILGFRDEMFLHGVSPLGGDMAFRDALIFITLRDGR